MQKKATAGSSNVNVQVLHELGDDPAPGPRPGAFLEDSYET